jgi:hypothetical protein
MRQPLDRSNRFAIGLHRQNRAGFYRSIIKVDRAGAALAGIATHVRAGQTQLFAQKINQQGSRLDLGLMLYSIDGHSYRESRVLGLSSHARSSSNRSSMRPDFLDINLVSYTRLMRVSRSWKSGSTFSRSKVQGQKACSC